MKFELKDKSPNRVAVGLIRNDNKVVVIRGHLGEVIVLDFELGAFKSEKSFGYYIETGKYHNLYSGDQIMVTL